MLSWSLSSSSTTFTHSSILCSQTHGHFDTIEIDSCSWQCVHVQYEKQPQGHYHDAHWCSQGGLSRSWIPNSRLVSPSFPVLSPVVVYMQGGKEEACVALSVDRTGRERERPSTFLNDGLGCCGWGLSLPNSLSLPCSTRWASVSILALCQKKMGKMSLFSFVWCSHFSCKS